MFSSIWHKTVVFSKLSGGTQWRPPSGPQWRGKITSRRSQGSPHVWEDSWWPKKTPRPLRPPSPWWDKWHGLGGGGGVNFYGVWVVYVIVVLWEGARERERWRGGERGRKGEIVEEREREEERDGGEGGGGGGRVQTTLWWETCETFLLFLLLLLLLLLLPLGLAANISYINLLLVLFIVC